GDEAARRPSAIQTWAVAVQPGQLAPGAIDRCHRVATDMSSGRMHTEPDGTRKGYNSRACLQDGAALRLSVSLPASSIPVPPTQALNRSRHLLRGDFIEPATWLERSRTLAVTLAAWTRTRAPPRPGAGSGASS